MTKQRLHDTESGRDRPVQIEITSEMIQAGAARLGDLIEAEVGLAYAAEEVFLSMLALEGMPQT